LKIMICINASRKTKLWERIWDGRRETLLHLVHRQILKIDKMSTVSLRVNSAELHDVALDTGNNDMSHAAVSDR
jgi:hypothetical protein